MLPLPPHWELEPKTIPHNIGDAPYRVLVKFIKSVWLSYFITILVFSGLVGYFLLPAQDEFLTQVGMKSLHYSSFVVLFLLWLFRSAHRTFQVVMLFLTLVVCSALVSRWINAYYYAFPLFTDTLGFVFLAMCISSVLYVLFSGYDYSFAGHFQIVSVCIVILSTFFGVFTELTWAEALTIAVINMGVLFYWVFDLAMILRRRREEQLVSAVSDLYRDLLNFAGYPFRVLRGRQIRRRKDYRWSS